MATRVTNSAIQPSDRATHGTAVWSRPACARPRSGSTAAGAVRRFQGSARVSRWATALGHGARISGRLVPAEAPGWPGRTPGPTRPGTSAASAPVEAPVVRPRRLRAAGEALFMDRWRRRRGGRRHDRALPGAARPGRQRASPTTCPPPCPVCRQGHRRPLMRWVHPPNMSVGRRSWGPRPSAMGATRVSDGPGEARASPWRAMASATEKVPRPLTGAHEDRATVSGRRPGGGADNP
jgi:hypothetical protein